MVNTTHPKPITDQTGRTIRTEAPRTETPRALNVANPTPKTGPHHLTRGRIPHPNSQEQAIRN